MSWAAIITRRLKWALMTDVPREYNAAVDLVGRNLAAGRGGKIAYIDDAGSCTYAQLAERVDRAANALHSLNIHREERIAIAMLDSADWVALFLGAIKAGIVPVAMNTLLTPADYEYQLRDSGARALFVSAPLLKSFEPIIKNCPDLKHVVSRIPEFLESGRGKAEAAPTCRDDMCFWLYSSGSTGRRRAPCTCIRTSPLPRSSTPSRSWASANPTSSSRRRSCSSPTAWATRSLFRSR